MQIINLDSNIYPNKLKKIQNVPEKLYVHGNIENIDKKSIAIIGSRDCSLYGKETAYQFAYELSKAGFCIVSGMAKGIDKYAHLGALDAEGSTVAVLGSGFNNIYPTENINLYNRIIQENGTVITEYKPNTKPESHNFPKRNRIVSGLSLAVLVVEAEYRSGTTITAGFALKQNKPVFCIPSNINSTKGIGTNKLIQEGAKMVVSVEDILEYMQTFEQENNSNIPAEYEEIYSVIEGNTITLNEICKKLNRKPNEISSILTFMEIEGYIEQISGQNFKVKER